MNRRILALTLTFALISKSFLSATIIETPHFADIVSHITPQTLVLLDIDDTLLIPVQTLGSDVSFLYRMGEYKSQGSTPEEALEKALADWEGIRHLTKVQIEEEGTAETIHSLQSQGFTVMALTTQGLALNTRTCEQLKSLGIDLSKTAPSNEDHYFINGPHGVLYRHGIFSTSGTPKGKALLQLLSRINCQPKRIVFINDKRTHLRDVESAVEAAGIEFIGLRYSHSDARVARFNPAIADIQWKHSSFGHILSDEEAEQILKAASRS